MIILKAARLRVAIFVNLDVFVANEDIDMGALEDRLQTLRKLLSI